MKPRRSYHHSALSWEMLGIDYPRSGENDYHTAVQQLLALNTNEKITFLIDAGGVVSIRTP